MLRPEIPIHNFLNWGPTRGLVLVLENLPQIAIPSGKFSPTKSRIVAMWTRGVEFCWEEGTGGVVQLMYRKGLLPSLFFEMVCWAWASYFPTTTTTERQVEERVDLIFRGGGWMAHQPFVRSRRRRSVSNSNPVLVHVPFTSSLSWHAKRETDWEH